MKLRRAEVPVILTQLQTCSARCFAPEQLYGLFVVHASAGTGVTQNKEESALTDVIFAAIKSSLSFIDAT